MGKVRRIVARRAGHVLRLGAASHQHHVPLHGHGGRQDQPGCVYRDCRCDHRRNVVPSRRRTQRRRRRRLGQRRRPQPKYQEATS